MSESFFQDAAKKERQHSHRILVKDTVQRESYGPEGGMLSDEISTRIQVRRGRGSALSKSDTKKYSAQFGRNMSDVRIHSDAESANLNETLSSRAFTVGSDIFLGKGISPKDNVRDSETLRHELTHVAQSDGKAGNGRLNLGAVNSHEEAEAASVAKQSHSNSAGDTVRREFHPLRGIMSWFNKKEAKLYGKADDNIGGALEEMSDEDKAKVEKINKQIQAKTQEIEKHQNTLKQIPKWKAKKSKHMEAYQKNTTEREDVKNNLKRVDEGIHGKPINQDSLLEPLNSKDIISSDDFKKASPYFQESLGTKKTLNNINIILENSPTLKQENLDGMDIEAFHKKFSELKAFYNDNHNRIEMEERELMAERLRPKNSMEEQDKFLAKNKKNKEEYGKLQEAANYINDEDKQKAFELLGDIISQKKQSESKMSALKDERNGLRHKENLLVANPDDTEQTRISNLDQMSQNYQDEILSCRAEIVRLKEERIKIFRNYKKGATEEQYENYNKNGFSRFFGGIFRGIGKGISKLFGKKEKINLEEGNRDAEVALGAAVDGNLLNDNPRMSDEQTAEPAEKSVSQIPVESGSQINEPEEDTEVSDNKIEELGKQMEKVNDNDSIDKAAIVPNNMLNYSISDDGYSDWDEEED